MKVVWLLIALNFCHFLADYTHLSTKWMLDAKRLGKPLFPIFIHALVHSMLMGFTLLWFVDSFNIYVGVLLFQLITHFGIDVLKGKLNWWFPKLANPANKWHWVVFGADQLLHQVVIILMVYFAFNG